MQIRPQAALSTVVIDQLQKITDQIENIIRYCEIKFKPH